MTPEKLKKAKQLINEELKKIVESKTIDIEEIKKQILKGLEISEEEYKVADFIPVIEEIINKKYKGLLPALEEIKEKLAKEFPVDYGSLKNKPNLEELRYNDSKIVSRIKKIIGKVNDINNKKIVVAHDELKRIGPDDHHKEKHILESHTESELLGQLYRLVSGEEVDDLHKHKVKVGTAGRNYGLYNPMHFHDDVYYKKSEVDALIAAGGGGGGTWGSITGTLSNQTDLQTALDAKLDDAQFSGLTKITVGTTEPTSPATGDLWVDCS